ncbi:hypothetical protein QFC22_002616 [Naganishia vaughanmartiniae]|uniref:Uncharacterized protein n=1 Tax=Naganishia vaughanmartiniae TaxID=1424756 RepID=A0ACC2X9H3_9TREE|nr:hypothetical protein QFC22_002616 [Naganishia vaughanmartiniae]
MFTPISTPPTFVTPEEHAQITSSTPSSFSDIPPALRYQDNEVELVIEPQLEAYGSSDRLKGSIWVTEEAFFFIPVVSSNGTAATTPTGFSLKYPAITLHAISPASEETGAYLYCQVDDPSAKGPGGNDEEDEGDDDDVPMRELKVFVKSEAQLTQLFNALSHCASLHPSPMSPGDDLSSQINFFGGNPDDEEDRELPFTITGMPNGADGAFEDAKEEDDSEPTVNGGRTRSDYQAGTERFRPY